MIIMSCNHCTVLLRNTVIHNTWLNTPWLHHTAPTIARQILRARFSILRARFSSNTSSKILWATYSCPKMSQNFVISITKLFACLRDPILQAQTFVISITKLFPCLRDPSHALSLPNSVRDQGTHPMLLQYPKLLSWPGDTPHAVASQTPFDFTYCA